MRVRKESRRLAVGLSARGYSALRASLVRDDDTREHAAFIFGKPQGDGLLEVVGVELLSEAHFTSQSFGYLELRDEALQAMILRAHRGRTALIEAHSHPFMRGPHVAFSLFDEAGLSEAAPHVTWRLPGRPYAALVFGRDAFDGLFWRGIEPVPSGSVDLVIDGERVACSGESLLRWECGT